MGKQFFSNINNAEIISAEKRTSKKGREYLQVVVKDNFRNEFSFVDFNIGHESFYTPNAKGNLTIKYSESMYKDTVFKNVEIDDFEMLNS